MNSLATVHVGRPLQTRPSTTSTPCPKKAALWPKPDYRSLVAKGHHPAKVRLLRFLWDWIPSSPRAKLPNASSYFERAVCTYRAATEAWFDTAKHTRLVASDFHAALSSVLATAWGYSPSDQRYASARWERSDRGCELHVLVGEKSPYARIPTAKAFDKISREIQLGWPTPRPAHESKGYFVVPASSIGIEPHGSCIHARWSLSSASDRGRFSSFTDRDEAKDFLESLPAYLVVTDRACTRIVSSHDDSPSASRAAFVAAGLPVPMALRGESH